MNPGKHFQTKDAKNSTLVAKGKPLGNAKGEQPRSTKGKRLGSGKRSQLGSVRGEQPGSAKGKKLGSVKRR